MIDYRDYWDKALSYVEYRAEIDRELAQGRTTGHVQTQELVDFSSLNNHRMNRIEKTYHPSEALVNKWNQVKNDVYVLTLTEGWCGDSAQIVPVIEKLLSAAGVDTRYLLRDDNDGVMQQHLSGGMRSIPMTIVLSKENNLPIAQWGSRPSGASQVMIDWKNTPEPKISKDEVKKQIQLWYAKDKQNGIENEFTSILENVTVDS